MAPTLATGATSGHALKPVAVLIVDDQAAVREGVARLIASAPIALRAIEVAASCSEARRIAAILRPEVVVLDADLAGEDGLALIGQLPPSARVLVLTCHGDAGTRARAARRGAAAFVEKQQPATELLAALVELAAAQSGRDKSPMRQGGKSQSTSVASSGAGSKREP